MDEAAAGPSLDADLANATRLLAEYEQAWPEDPNSSVRAFIERFVHRPPADLLYPALTAAADPHAWLAPLLHRLARHGAEPATGLNPARLVEMLELAMDRVHRVTAEEFAGLTAQLELRRLRFLRRMPAFARQLEDEGPLSDAVLDALARLHLLSATPHSPTGGFSIWPLLPQHPAVCWSARVRLDVEGMDPKARDAWRRAFSGGKHHLSRNELDAGLRRWCGALRHSGLALTSAGAVLLRQTIQLTKELDGDACDELLYGIACAPWSADTELTWVPPYLDVVRGRPHDRAFACLEALAMNPVTALDAVRSQYEALLAIFGAGALPNADVGEDGFPLESELGLAAEHARIDQLLRLASTRPAAAQQAMEAALLKEFAADPAALYRALMQRLQWIQAHAAEYDPAALVLWRKGLAGVLQNTLAGMRDLPLDSLLFVIRTSPGRIRVLDLCEHYVAAHGWHRDLVEPFRQWISTLGVAQGDQVYRARAEWLLWFEPFTAVDLDACWSHRVKQDLRTMPAEEAAAWRALLQNVTFVMPGKPPQKWMKAAARVFPKLGVERFRHRFIDWFAPFAAAEPLRITVVGRNLLRLLMWYALLAKDRAVDSALLGYAHANWKTKDAAKRVAQAEMAFSHAISARVPEAALPVLEDLVRSGRAFAGSTTHRIYRELCTRARRAPVDAGPSPVLDDVTLDALRTLLQMGTRRSR